MIRQRQKKSHITIDLDGPEGNAFALLAQARALCRELDLDFATVQEQMTQGDYEHLINTFDRYFGDFVILER